MDEKSSAIEGQKFVRKPLLSLDDTDEEESLPPSNPSEAKHKSSIISIDLKSNDDNNDEPEQTFVTILPSSSQGDSSNDDGRTSIHQPLKPMPMKLISALFYGLTSFLIVVINKIVLTTYKFPSYHFLGIGQMIAIIIILGSARQFKMINFPRLTRQKLSKIWILSVLYLGNLIAGLGSTKHLSLPMLIALRRFSIAMTAIGEFYLLKIRQSPTIIMTIVAMIGGSLIAASTDLSFNALGYFLVMTNNFCTAGNVVYMKKVLNAKDIDKYELLYYNALLMIVPLSLICAISTDLTVIFSFEHWLDIGFLISFLLSCIMGFLLMQSTMLCIYYNSPLTTTIVGTLKNILSTYVGMYIGGDYEFTLMNFLGLNISLIGSLVYSYFTFVQKNNNKPASTKC